MFISYSWLLHIFQFFALPSVCSNMCVHSCVCVCFTQYACIWATLNRLVFARCVIIRSEFTIRSAIRFDFICICCCCYFCVHILSALWFNHVVVRLLLQLSQFLPFAINLLLKDCELFFMKPTHAYAHLHFSSLIQAYHKYMHFLRLPNVLPLLCIQVGVFFLFWHILLAHCWHVAIIANFDTFLAD